MSTTLYNSIAPKKVIRGEKAWQSSIDLIKSICDRPLLIGKSVQTSPIRDHIKTSLKLIDVNPINELLEYGCCEIDLSRVQEVINIERCDAIIAAGGGKVLDAGKLLANRTNLPCITVPLSAATCAGWTALSNIYSSSGAFIKDITLNNCPDLLVFDHSFVRSAPPRTLASGIADALAKWYECSIFNQDSLDGQVQHAVQISRVLRDQLLIDGEKAFNDKNSYEWIRVAEGCALTAGLMGGIGGTQCRTAAAHAIHNGLTQIESTSKILHGEIVGFGILVQLYLEEINANSLLAKQSRKQLMSFMEKINLTTSIKSIGRLQSSIKELEKACLFSCNNDEGMKQLPFNVEPNELLDAIIKIGDIKEMQVLKKTD